MLSIYRTAAMFYNSINVREYVDSSISRTFPDADWVCRFSTTRSFGSRIVMVHYMFLGDETGILYKLKQANKSEMLDNIGNGYIVVWEREEP